MVEAHGIGVFRGRALLDGVHVAPPEGRLTAIVGPNGAGKTTLLHVLDGELVPDRGTVTLDARELASWRPRDLARRRAVLPQHSELAFGFSVQEVVAMGRMPFDEPARTTEDHVAHVLEALDLVPFAERSWLTLSGGERQRVQLARVLVQLAGVERALLFLDEPTNHLDLAHRVHVLQRVRERVEHGLTAICVLHDLTLAARIADHVVLLADGRVVSAGPPDQVLTADRLSSTFGVAITCHRGPDGPVFVPRLG